MKKTTQGQELFAKLAKYRVVEGSITDNIPVTKVNDHSCYQVQFFATTLDDLTHIDVLIQQVSATEVGQYFCFSAPRYIALSQLKCAHNPTQAITCNESIWQPYINRINSRYLGVVVPKGGANVHSGILYLDSNDDINVFKHELLHLLGFVDEYPLPNNHTFCQQVSPTPTAHNVAALLPFYRGIKEEVRKKVLTKISWAHLIKPSTPILFAVDDKWQVGTPVQFNKSVGVFPVNTCENSKVFAVKPISQHSPLAYFDLMLPALYQQLLQTNSDRYLMPSFHYNIASALEKKGDKVNALLWRNKAISHSKESVD